VRPLGPQGGVRAVARIDPGRVGKRPEDLGDNPGVQRLEPRLVLLRVPHAAREQGLNLGLAVCQGRAFASPASVASSLTSTNGSGSAQERVLPGNPGWRSRVLPISSACSGRLPGRAVAFARVLDLIREDGGLGETPTLPLAFSRSEETRQLSTAQHEYGMYERSPDTALVTWQSRVGATHCCAYPGCVTTLLEVVASPYRGSGY
jgi:hypothetical protein